MFRKIKEILKSLKKFCNKIWQIFWNVKIFEENLKNIKTPYECTPNPQLDPLWTHRLGFKATAGLRTRRHDELEEVIANPAVSADPNASAVAREEHLPDDSETQRRPGDVALNLGDGRSLVDVTVASPFSTACDNASRFAGSPAAAAEAANDRKTREWRALLDSNGMDQGQMVTSFMPLAVSALGVWDGRSLSLCWLKRFSNVCSASTGEPSGTFYASLMIRLSVALWRANSRILRALRAHSEFEIRDSALVEEDFDWIFTILFNRLCLLYHY